MASRNTPKVVFVLPVYNEEVNLSRLVENLNSLAERLGLDARVIAVDDGSHDGSLDLLRQLAKRFPLDVLIHDTNLGPGAAFRTAFQYVSEKYGDQDVVITMDADNTHSDRTVSMMISGINEGYELVVASVFATGGMMIGVPFFRYLLTMGCNFLYRILFPVRGMREYTGFYRALPVSTLRTGFNEFGQDLITATGFACMAEMLVKFRQIPIFMKEVPMIVRYDRKGGKSKMRIFRTIREHIFVIAGNLFRRRVL